MWKHERETYHDPIRAGKLSAFGCERIKPPSMERRKTLYLAICAAGVAGLERVVQLKVADAEVLVLLDELLDFSLQSDTRGGEEKLPRS